MVFRCVRKIIERAQPDLNADFDGRSLADALMAPTHIYVKPLLALMQQIAVKGMAHITGGGLVENIPRVLREGLTAELDHRGWPLPPLFSWLQKHGGVADAEMHRVFNCGIGMAVDRVRCGRGCRDRSIVGNRRAGLEDRRDSRKRAPGGADGSGIKGGGRAAWAMLTPRWLDLRPRFRRARHLLCFSRCALPRFTLHVTSTLQSPLARAVASGSQQSTTTRSSILRSRA